MFHVSRLFWMFSLIWYKPVNILILNCKKKYYDNAISKIVNRYSYNLGETFYLISKSVNIFCNVFNIYRNANINLGAANL